MDRIEYTDEAGGWRVRRNRDLAARARASGDWPYRTTADYARQRATAEPQRVLLVEGSQEFAAGEIWSKSLRLAGWFESIGLHRGDVVSFQLPNWWEAAVIDLAAAVSGLVVNPIVPINREAEVTYMLAESRSKVMFVPAAFRNHDYLQMMRQVLPRLPRPPRVVVLRGLGDGFETFEDTQNSEPLKDLPYVDPDSVKLLMYTSGTTGRPKGVLHSHNTILADCVKMRPVMHLRDTDSVFCPSPLTHVTGYLWILTMPWYGGTCAVTVDLWDAKTAFEMLRQRRCVLMLGATPFLQGILEVVRNRGETLPDLRYYLCGGAAVPPSLIYEAAELLPNCIPWRNFGATEATTMTCCPESRDSIRLGAETDGRLYRAEVKIVDVATGRPVPAGAEGELLVREPSMALGYARSEDNEGAYDEEGFFRMGDLGRLVEGDHIVCTGRLKDLIIRAGENISAKEIEDVLFRCPKIADVAVVSMPSRKTGEAVCAFIVPAAGESVDFAKVSELIRHAGLARQKTPEHVEIVASRPLKNVGN